MSRSVTKAKAKAERKEKAIKKARRKTILIVCIFALVIIAAAAVGILVNSRQPNSAAHGEAETYSHGNQTIQLFADGTFSARLAHNVNKNGTFTKSADGTRVSFNTDGRTETGRIENNAMHLPHEWDDGHGHGNVFVRTSE